MKKLKSRTGQALIMVTLALFVMIGMIGLAVDVGWSFYVKKTARAAADAAAMAAVKTAYATVTQSGPWQCTSASCTPGSPCMVCEATPKPCSQITAGNLYNGCQYAARNGFTSGGRQEVKLQSGVTTSINTDPIDHSNPGPVNVHYYVTAIVTETVPQLFSAIFQPNNTALVSARATAAIIDMTVPGTLILLNRRHDHTGMGGGGGEYGVNLLVSANDNQGHFALQTGGGIRMASDCGPSVPQGPNTCTNNSQWMFAGENKGGGTIKAPETRIRSTGWYHNQGSAQWIQTPTNGTSSGFNDPMAGKGQPPPYFPAYAQNPIPVLNGIINTTICPKGVCSPGQYYAYQMTTCSGKPCGTATGDPLTINGNITFSSGGSFGNYTFYGGLQAGGGKNTATFEPGIYVLAGVRNSGGVLLNTSTNFNLLDDTTSTGKNSDAGELFIFTNGQYPNANGVAQLTPPPPTWNDGLTPVSWPPNLEKALFYGSANFQSGNNNTTINLHGLNPDASPIKGSALETFAPSLIWWDQGNSTVKHDINGNVVTDATCGGNGTLDGACVLVPADLNSTELQIGASPKVNLYGTVYQPRGTWTTMIGGGGYMGPIQLITGALKVQGNANVNLVVPEDTVEITIVALIQ